MNNLLPSIMRNLREEYIKPWEDYYAQPRSSSPALEAHFKRYVNDLRVMQMNLS